MRTTAINTIPNFGYDDKTSKESFMSSNHSGITDDSTKVTQKEKFKRSIITPKTTGYAAASALFLAGIRTFSKDKNLIKSHKTVGIIASIFTILHVGLIEYYHHKYKKM